MILSDLAKSRPRTTNFWAWPLFLVFAIGLLYLSSMLTGEEEQVSGIDSSVIYCDAENRVEDHFLSNGRQFDQAVLQSSEQARSGQYAVKFEKEIKGAKAMVYTFDQIVSGATYRASVWRYRSLGGKKGFLVAEAKGANGFKISENLINREENNWEEILLFFHIAKESKLDTLQVYVTAQQGDEYFFDDLTIQQVESGQDLVEQPALQNMNLLIDEKAMQKLDAKRQKAYRAGLLETGEDDWVKARIELAGTERPLRAEIRLKGDWLDHLHSKKWSFRIKLKGNDTWNQLRTFSVHTPSARSFLHEYVLHRFFTKEGVLTPRYDFVNVSINGESRGVYAVEEHFEKILVESQHRREGPIVKMIEDGFWAGIKRGMQAYSGIDLQIKESVRSMETADIAAFKQKQTNNSPVLSKQFEMAQNLLYQYRYGLKSTEEIFDLDLLARYYAICDVMGAFHGMTWHNQRFYYNPVTSKLEPIGFDGYGAEREKRNFILAQGALNPNRIKKEKLDNKLFMDRAFVEKYLEHLRRYSSKSYLNPFLMELERELANRERLIRSEFKNYRLNREDVLINAQRVGSLILPYNELSLKAHVQGREDGKQFLQIANTHDLPIEVIGFGRRADHPTDMLEAPILLEGFLPRRLMNWSASTQHTEEPKKIFDYNFNRKAFEDQSFLRYQVLEVKESSRYLFFRPLGLDSTFYTPIRDWPIPQNKVAAQDLFANVQLTSNDWMTVDDRMVYIHKGEYQIEEKIIIPEGYHVYFEAGTHIDFIKNAGFISRSPVFLYGTEDDPIRLFSSDQSANGFTVLQAKERSKMHYVVVDHFNTLNYQGWTLTGAVTFYESNVDVDQAVFKNNHCEDGLNFIRCDFTVSNSLVSHTASDGLDADFCKGKIESTRFYQTGNDGMDFSGSNMLIMGCRVDGSGDKGLSVGEATDATVHNVVIENAVIGMASKDLSFLVANNIHLINCSQGFAAYQKKPEFGGSKILINHYTTKDVRRLHNIRRGCQLELKGKVIKGE